MRAVPPQVIPRPLHDERATLRQQARQLLADLDRDSVNTSVPTATLELILTSLVTMIDAKVAPAQSAVAEGMLMDPANNPNLAYWQRRADQDDERSE